MRILILVGALALAAGCTRIDEKQASSGASSAINGCDAVATQPWRPLSGAEFTVEAWSRGPDCERAVATLAVRDAQGDLLWAEASPSAHIMVLAQAHDVAAMRTALADWTNAANNTTMTTTAALPDWPQGSDGPVSGEFPFYTELDRDYYLGYRQTNAPLLCYVQGMESMACLALRDGALEKVGVQAFPG